ncbi:MAG: right-handed parallel beta-helix repeat-containing protein [Lachnospiraceae bacterium]|nr:right-handed parallel beta-helix repeat-containing protein [Lachnospiraceae bacterium]
MKKQMVTAMALLLCVTLTGCGIIPGFLRKHKDDEPDKPQTTEQPAQDTDEEDIEEPEAPAATDEAAQAGDRIGHKELIGNWQLVCETDYSAVPGIPLERMDSYFYMAEEIGHMELYIYEDNGALFADYDLGKYEMVGTGYHLPVEIVNEALYEGSANQEWVAKIVNPRTKEDVCRLTLEEDNKLVEFESYEYGEGEDAWHSVTISTFLREGSKEMEHKDDLRYNETITVSNVMELLQAIGDGKKIILKEGVYDISRTDKSLRNSKVVINNGWDSESDTVVSVSIKDVENLCLKAEEGAKVEICVTDPYVPVMTFNGCRNVILDGITAGHHVEPGTCGGSVIQLQDGYNYHISNCHLYGCGTYGIEAMNTSDIHVDQTEIYECTYGIVDLANVYNASFTNCTMHDNKDMSMISLSQCSDVVFTDCAFRDNFVDSQNYFSVRFVQANESYGTALHHCTFTGNTYGRFHEGDVEIDNCSFKDTITGDKAG